MDMLIFPQNYKYTCRMNAPAGTVFGAEVWVSNAPKSTAAAFHTAAGPVKQRSQ
jgi:hypothetical protein